MYLIAKQILVPQSPMPKVTFIESAVYRLHGPASKYHSTSLLLRRFVFRKVEASDWWWTARDHGKGTDGRRSAVSPVVSFPPSFARTFSSRERETSGYEAATRLRVWFLPLSPLWNGVLKSPFVWGICYSILTLEQGRFSNPWLFPIKLRWNNTSEPAAWTGQGRKFISFWST